MLLQGFRIISHNAGCPIDECMHAMTGIKKMVDILWRADGSLKDSTAVIGKTENKKFSGE